MVGMKTSMYGSHQSGKDTHSSPNGCIALHRCEPKTPESGLQSHRQFLGIDGALSSGPQDRRAQGRRHSMAEFVGRVDSQTSQFSTAGILHSGMLES